MTSTRRRPVGPVGKIPARSLQRPTGPVYAGRTDLEREFRELVEGIKTSSGRVEVNPVYSVWAAKVRAVWMREHVEYRHDDGSWHPDPPENGKQLLAWRHKS